MEQVQAAWVREQAEDSAGARQGTARPHTGETVPYTASAEAASPGEAVEAAPGEAAADGAGMHMQQAMRPPTRRHGLPPHRGMS